MGHPAATGPTADPPVGPDRRSDRRPLGGLLHAPGGRRRSRRPAREVFGFLPYWELADPSTTLDWEKLSTIAYFGVGAAANGDLQRQEADGSTTVGWSGWTSSNLTNVINAAHANGARVVLTVQSFGWTSSELSRQQALLGEPDRPRQPRPPDRGRRARSRRRRRQPRLRADRGDLRRRVHVARPVDPEPSSTRSRPATSSRSTRWAGSATTRSRRPPRPAAPTPS